MSNVAKLELNLVDTGFEKAATDARNLGTAFQQTDQTIKTATNSVKQAETQSVSFGSKLKTLGSGFQSTVANVSTLGLSIVNLQRGYRDLGDAQIAVDRSNLRLNRSQEALAKAQQKLTQIQKQGKTGGKEYEQALLDVSQATEDVKLKTQLAGEAQERFGDIQQNFWMSVVPTITSAGGTLLSMFDKLGGSGGVGGLMGKLKSLQGTVSGLSGSFGGLKGNILGLGITAGAIGLVTTGAIALADGMNKVAAAFSKVKEPVSVVEALTDTSGKSLKTFNQQLDETDQYVKAKVPPIALALDAVFGSHITQKMLENQKVTEQTKQKWGELWDYSAWAALGKGGIIEGQIVKVTADVKGLGATISTFFQDFSQSAGALMNPQTNPFAMITKGTAVGLALKSTMMPAADEMKSVWDSATQAVNDASDILANNFVTSQTDMANAAAAAAQKSKTEWDKAFNIQVSGIDKLIAAYHKLHPDITTPIKNKKGKVIGQKTTEFRLPIDQAQDVLTAFESTLAQTLTSKGTFKKYALDWVNGMINTSTKYIGPAAAKLVKPITDYINAHKTEAPAAFMNGFVAFLQGFDLTQSMVKVYDPLVTQAGTTGTQIGTNLGKIDTAPAVTKIDAVKKAFYKILPQYRPTISINDLATQKANTIKAAINKILPQYKPTIAINDLATQRAEAIQTAINNIKSKTVTVTVKAQLDRQLGDILPTAIRNNPGHAGGWSGTVRRPTMMMVGEGGREEDISIRPIGSTGHSGGNGGGGTEIINIYLDGQKIHSEQRRKMNEFQGAYK